MSEKCDVYSFGVVALEVLMGKHLGEILPSLTSSCNRNILLIDILDPRLSPPMEQTVVQDIFFVSSVALACLHSNPKSQPSMQRVSQEFLVQMKSMLKSLKAISIAQPRSHGMLLVEESDR